MKRGVGVFVVILLLLPIFLVSAQEIDDKDYWATQLQGDDLTLIYQAIILLGQLGDEDTLTLFESQKPRILDLAKSEFGEEGESTYFNAFESSIRKIKGQTSDVKILDPTEKVIILDTETGRLEIEDAKDITLYGVKTLDHDWLPHPERLVGFYDDSFGVKKGVFGSRRCRGSLETDIFENPKDFDVIGYAGLSAVTTTFKNVCLKGQVNNLYSYELKFKVSNSGDYIYKYLCERETERRLLRENFLGKEYYTVTYNYPTAAIYSCDCINGKCVDKDSDQKGRTFTLNGGSRVETKKFEFVNPVEEKELTSWSGRVLKIIKFKEANSIVTHWKSGGPGKGGSSNILGAAIFDLPKLGSSVIGAATGGGSQTFTPSPGIINIPDPDFQPPENVPIGIPETINYEPDPVVQDLPQVETPSLSSDDSIWDSWSDDSLRFVSYFTPREVVGGGPRQSPYHKYGTKMKLYNTKVSVNGVLYTVIPKGIAHYYHEGNIYSGGDLSQLLPSNFEEQAQNLFGGVSSNAITENVKNYADTAREGSQRKLRDLFRKNPNNFKNLLKKVGKALAGKYIDDEPLDAPDEDDPPQDKDKKEKPKVDEVSLYTDRRVFGNKIADPKVGGSGFVGNNRPGDLNPDYNVLSDQDPWVCGIDFDLGPEDRITGQVPFTLVDDGWNTLFTGNADCNGFFCSGIIPRGTVERGKRVACIYDEDGEDIISNWIDVAKILFIVTEAKKEGQAFVGGTVNNLEDQLSFFLERTFLQAKDYKIIRRNSKSNGALEDDCRAQISVFAGSEVFSTDECLKELGETWDEEKDVLIHAQHLDREPLSRIEHRNIFLTKDDHLFYLAQLMGNLFGLADEVDQFAYDKQKEDNNFVNEYPACCSDYFDFRNPYLSITHDYGVVEVQCEESGASCKNSCRANEMPLSLRFYNTCEASEKCCLNKFDAGNNCYPRHITVGMGCAGMPLNGDGRKSFDPISSGTLTLSDQGLDTQGKLYLDAEFRSIMGSAKELVEEDFPEENLIYPNVVGLGWPLKPGISDYYTAISRDDRLQPSDRKAIDSSGLSVPMKAILEELIVNLYDETELRNIIARAEIYHGELFNNDINHEVREILGDARYGKVSNSLREIRYVKDQMLLNSLSPVYIEILYDDATKKMFIFEKYQPFLIEKQLSKAKNNENPYWIVWAYTVALREARLGNIYQEMEFEEKLTKLSNEDNVFKLNTFNPGSYIQKKEKDLLLQSSRKRFIPLYSIIVDEEKREMFLDFDDKLSFFQQLDLAAGDSGIGYMITGSGDGADVVSSLSRIIATLNGDIEFDPLMMGAASLGAAIPFLSMKHIVSASEAIGLTDKLAKSAEVWSDVMRGLEKVGIHLRKNGRLVVRDSDELVRVMRSAAGEGSESFTRGAIKGLKSKKVISDVRGGADILEMARHSDGTLEIRSFGAPIKGEQGARATVEMAAIDVLNAHKIQEEGMLSYVNSLEAAVTKSNKGKTNPLEYPYAVGRVRPDGVFEYATGGTSRFYAISSDGTITKLSSGGTALGRGGTHKVATHTLKSGDQVVQISDSVLEGVGFLNGRSLTEAEDIIEQVLRQNADESLENIQKAVSNRVKTETKILLEGSSAATARARLAGKIDDSSLALIRYGEELVDTGTKIKVLRNTPYGQVTLVSTPALRKAEQRARELFERTGIEVRLTGGNLRNGVLGQDPFASKDIDVHIRLPDGMSRDLVEGGAFLPELEGKSMWSYLKDVVFEDVDGAIPDILLINGKARAQGAVEGADFSISRVEYSLATGSPIGPERYWQDIVRKQIALTDLEDIPNYSTLSPSKILKALKNLKPTTNFHGKALRMARFAGQYLDSEIDDLTLQIIKKEVDGFFKKIDISYAGGELDDELYKVFANTKNVEKSLQVLKDVGLYGKLKKAGYDLDAYAKYSRTKDPSDLWDAVRNVKYEGESVYVKFADNGRGPHSLMSPNVRRILGDAAVSTAKTVSKALESLPTKSLDDLGLALGDSSVRMNIDGENVYVTLFTESSSINQLRGVEILAEMKDSPGTARIRGVVTRIDDQGEKVIVGYYKENLSPLEGWEDINPLKTPLSPAELKMYRETVEAAHAKGITHGNLKFDDMRGTFSTDDSGRFVVEGWRNALRRSDVGDAAFEARKARDLADVKAAEDFARSGKIRSLLENTPASSLEDTLVALSKESSGIDPRILRGISDEEAALIYLHNPDLASSLQLRGFEVEYIVRDVAGVETKLSPVIEGGGYGYAHALKHADEFENVQGGLENVLKHNLDNPQISFGSTRRQGATSTVNIVRINDEVPPLFGITILGPDGKFVTSYTASTVDLPLHDVIDGKVVVGRVVNGRINRPHIKPSIIGTFESSVKSKDLPLYLPKAGGEKLVVEIGAQGGNVKYLEYDKSQGVLKVTLKESSVDEFTTLVADLDLATSNTKVNKGIDNFKTGLPNKDAPIVGGFEVLPDQINSINRNIPGVSGGG